jgi:hypothetical protein
MNTNKPFNRDPFDRQHGSLYDRGSADSYYGRPRDPHWYPEGTYKGPRVPAKTEYEIAEYEAGFRDNEESGSFKDWG